MGAADLPDLVDAGKARGGQYQRVEPAFGARHHHDEALDAGDLGGYRIHQHGTGIGGGAAGNIKADGLDRGPAAAEFDADGVGVAVVCRLLAGMVGLDAVAGQRQGVEGVGIDGGNGRVDLGGGDAQGLDRGTGEAVEAGGQIEQGGIAAGADIGDDVAHDGVDVGRHFALHSEQVGKATLEIAI